MAEVILDVADITVEYGTSGKPARAVDQVSFQLARGEFLGIVGESGCGKSTLLFAIAQLLSPPAQLVGGTVTFKGRDMVGLTGEALRTLRWRRLFCRHAKCHERTQPGADCRGAI